MSVPFNDSVILPRLVEELKISPRQIQAVAQLLADGNTIPFIARYRKEAHGNLDEVQIGRIQERLAYYGELEERRAAILKSVDEQGKLAPELRAKIEKCMVKTTLEDLYAPYRPKRRTRAMIAQEKGLEPLADLLAAQGDEKPETAAAQFLAGRSVSGASDKSELHSLSVDDALAGARDIVAERVADSADIRGLVRHAFATQAKVVSEVVTPKPAEPTKFEQYYDFSEPIAAMPSHRFLAIRRGQKEGVVLLVRLVVESAPLLARMEVLAGLTPASPWAPQLKLAVADAYKRLVAPSCEIDVMVEKKLESDRAAVEVFAENLRHLLLAAPLGEKAVLAVDPGIRTGCKVAMLDATGKFLAHAVIFPAQRTAEAMNELAALVENFHPAAIAVGNGTAGRETESFVRGVLRELHAKDVITVSVSEAGASVYSASEIARGEFPDLDLTVRGAISIGRRLQDPLAELVKIDPQAIGVGQYQHDVHQPLLAGKLDEVVVSCVNKVGVELNTASAPLLTRVSGIGESLAKKVVAWRDAHGAFASRAALKEVPGLGPKAFEQSAGFLRIHGAKNPLDASAVHPERYALVETMAKDLGVAVKELVGNADLAGKIDIHRYITNDVGEPTLKDIVEELKKPGRDPRAIFEPPAFREDVTTIDDVKEGMELEGVVTNVTAFGAFVDIGIHQDGLVHVSELADHFVRDPAEVVKAGDRIKMHVLAVDKARNRVSLSARTKPRPGVGANPQPQDGTRSRRPPAPGHRTSATFVCNPFANL